MGVIATGEITITSVNDAYTVSLSPETRVINADYSGNPYDLSELQTRLTVKRGNKTIPFSILQIIPDNCIVQFPLASIGEHLTGATLKVSLITNNALSGGFDVKIKTEDGSDYTTTAKFSFSIVRESTMLDWIQDWNDNMTRIAGSYILTPKIFIGHKEDVVEVNQSNPNAITPLIHWRENALTGVYIGPDLLESEESSVGIYGYLHSNTIFRINTEGGLIAGWSFNHAGIYSPSAPSGGAIQILSQGKILAVNNNQPRWQLNADGSGILAGGNITWTPEGSAGFKGKIIAKEGQIGGWSIDTTSILSDQMMIDGLHHVMGVAMRGYSPIEVGTESTVNPISAIQRGGVMMYYTSSTDFGIAGYLPTSDSEGYKKLFSVGSSNVIAGWTFDEDAIYIGKKQNQQKTYTDTGSHITIGTHGLRGSTWYIDQDGCASFASGKIQFSYGDTASIAGWNIQNTRLSSNHMALVSGDLCGGIYLSAQELNGEDSEIANTIDTYGGFYIHSDIEDTSMRAVDNNGHVCFAFSVKPGENIIGDWHFNHEALFNGSTSVDENGFMSQSNHIMLSANGLRGFRWKLLADGSGAIAGGNIQWTAGGVVSFADNVSLNWSNISGALGNKLTQIDSDGVYTGTVSADHITAGTIIGSTVQQAAENPSWEINYDGSGHLAKRNIIWNTNGELSISGDLSLRTLRYFVSDSEPIEEDEQDHGYYRLLNHAFQVGDISEQPRYILPHLEPGEVRIAKLFITIRSRTYGFTKFKVEHPDDYIVFGYDLYEGPVYKVVRMSDLPCGSVGYFELIGQNLGPTNVTTWHIIPIYH